MFLAERRYDIVVRLTESARSTPDQIGDLTIQSASGARIPLAQLATIALPGVHAGKSKCPGRNTRVTTVPAPPEISSRPKWLSTRNAEVGDTEPLGNLGDHCAAAEVARIDLVSVELESALVNLAGDSDHRRLDVGAAEPPKLMQPGADSADVAASAVATNRLHRDPLVAPAVLALVFLCGVPHTTASPASRLRLRWASALTSLLCVVRALALQCQMSHMNAT